MLRTSFQDSFSAEVWETTYKDHNDSDINDTLTRIAKAIASVEATSELKELWEKRFYDLLTNFKGVPGGRIISNAGTEWSGTTLMNCISGDTLVHTQNGAKMARELSGKVMTLSKGGVYRPAEWYSYGNQPLLEVTLSNGDKIKATP